MVVDLILMCFGGCCRVWHGGSVLVVIIAVVVGGMASYGGGWLSFLVRLIWD